MTIAQKFIKKLQDSTAEKSLPKFWETYSSDAATPTFQAVLDKYAEYYNSEHLSTAQKEDLSKLFWEQIKALGTPIIEKRLDSKLECDVYFLLPKAQLKESEEEKINAPGTKKDLYLQGDFHGYGSVDGRQQLIEFKDTGIMLRRDQITKNALLTYSYIEVEPSYHGKKPEPESKPFFINNKKFVPRITDATKFPEIPQRVCIDANSLHAHPYGFESPERIFRVSDDATQAYLPGKIIDWPSLLNTDTQDSKKNFVFHSTLYSTKESGLQRSKTKVTPHYHDDVHDSDEYNLSFMKVSSFIEMDTEKLGEKPFLIKDEQDKYKIWGYKENTWQLTDIELTKEDSLKFAPKFEQNQNLLVFFTDEIYDTLKEGHTLPYATFTRDIQVFKPASKIIDDIFVINDGVPYLITGILDQFETMVDKQQISPNTAFVFINPMPGLKTTLSPAAAKAFANDPSAQVSGMGVRLIDYKHGIDQYADFLAKLLPDLEKNVLKISDDPNHKINRIMIGSSLSGTASAYIGLTCPTLFEAVIAQSPSPDNRAILSKIPSEMLIGDNIHITCGKFEQPKFAAANDNLSYATELSEHLGKKPLISAHGHQFVAWNEELERVIPAVRLTLDTKVTNTHVLVEKDPAGSKRAVSPIPKSQLAVDPEKTRKYRNQMSELRQSQPGYMAPTESSEAKKREFFNPTPVQTIPKPPWKP